MVIGGSTGYVGFLGVGVEGVFLEGGLVFVDGVFGGMVIGDGVVDVDFSFVKCGVVFGGMVIGDGVVDVDFSFVKCGVVFGGMVIWDGVVDFFVIKGGEVVKGGLGKVTIQCLKKTVT